MKRISSSMLKSLWLFVVVLVIMSGNGLSLWILIPVLIVLMALPLLRELTHKADADERQIFISHFSSHIALYVFIALTLFVMIHNYRVTGQHPGNQWYMVLLVPLIVKMIISLIQNYGAAAAGRWIGYFFASVWLLFVLFGHGLSVETLIEALPFILLIAIAWFSQRQPLICGLLYVALSLGSLFFFSGWIKMGIYGLILMYSLIPLPVFISGVALILSFFKKEDKE